MAGADSDGGAPPDGARINRRQVLHVLGAGGLTAALGGALPHAEALASMSPPALDTRPPAGARTAPFALQDVRLLESPFLEAQRRNERYLLLLDPDRLLHNFRANAGLAPKAPVYGGWESQEPWVEIRCHGHTLGHYLSACAMTYAATGDARFEQRARYVVAELSACQAASGSGLVCAFPDGPAQLDNSLHGRPFLGVPWYTLHKIFAGLRDAYTHTGDPAARAALVRLADWADQATAHLGDAQFQRLLDREHGGMNEILADVHVLTGEAKYLELAERFCHRAVLEPLAAGRDPLDGLHANTQIPKVIGFSRLHDLTGRADYRRAAEYFWASVTGRRSYATGGQGDLEHYFPPEQFRERLQSAKTMETCCTHNMLRLTRALFGREPRADYADYYERGLYNGILASQDPDTGMLTYFQATRPNYLKLYCTPTDSFWCCTGSGIENHAKYGDSIYFQGGDALYVNLFVPSTVRWRERGLLLTQNTGFPDQPRTRLEVRADRPTALDVMIRHPYWCDAPTVRINGKQRRTHREPSGYLRLHRTWRTGDVVEVTLPMHLHTEPLPEAPDHVALLYGPLVLAARLGSDGITPGSDVIVNERTSGGMLHVPMDVPRWDLDPLNPAEHVQAGAGPLTFHARGIAGLGEVELIPYHRIAHERYNLYWRVG